MRLSLEQLRQYGGYFKMDLVKSGLILDNLFLLR